MIQKKKGKIIRLIYNDIIINDFFESKEWSNIKEDLIFLDQVETFERIEDFFKCYDIANWN